MQRTLLGGMSLRARMAGLIVLSIAAIAGFAGLFYVADQRSEAALQRLQAAMQIQRSIGKVQAAALAELGSHRNMLAAKAETLVKDYDRGIEALSSNLKTLIENPAAIDGQKTALTLNDGFTQHATHFHNAAKIAVLLGARPRTGLIGNARALGDKLEGELAKINRAALASGLGRLRLIEAAAARDGAAPNEKVARAELRKLAQAISKAPIEATARAGLAKLASAYGADLTQLLRMREMFGREVSRLDEIDAYIAPNIQTLALFGGNLDLSARQFAAETQNLVRQLLAGGGGAILAVLILAALLMLASVTKPVRGLAHAASFLARGDHGTGIPALGNYDETGELAHALVQFRENMAHAQRLRDELELRLQKAEAEAAASARAAASAEAATSEDTAPEDASEDTAADAAEDAATQPESTEVLAPAAGLQNLSNINIADLSRQLAETSQNASTAAHEAERTEMIINGLASSLNRIDQTETLMASISDQMSLLVVQSQLTDEPPVGDQANLVLLADKRRDDENGAVRSIGQSLSDRIGVIQSGTNQAIRSIQQIGETIGAVNDVALEFAAESSSDALDVATVLLQQSEELRGKLDDLLGKIKLEGGALPNYSSGGDPE
ncbi:MAG: hypothetical protein QGH73_05405 [Rhodospirillales bacterium]|nr:hypothetical protein [Rhodospirillales bacterium]MDP6643968.1 hypothetical protein [Rhodospirillales bacterium]MDP6841095.1 hypothetical protein [Rhodospirillales bacterium]